MQNENQNWLRFRGDWRWPRFYEVRPLMLLMLVVSLVGPWVLVSSFYTQHSYSTQLWRRDDLAWAGLVWTSELCWFKSPKTTSKCVWRKGTSDLGEVSTAPHHRLSYTDTVTTNPLWSICLCVWGQCFVNSSVMERNTSHVGTYWTLWPRARQDCCLGNHLPPRAFIL